MINVNERHLAELKEQKIWMLWRKETRRDSKGEPKPTKVPVNAFGARTGTDQAHAGDWMTFEEALQAGEATTCEGIGFKIPEGVFFLDIDHRDIEDPLVKTLLERFGSYAERSCSGNGFHIYGKYALSSIPTVTDKNGKVRLAPEYYLKNPHNGVELYFGDLSNRFAVFTGDCVFDAPLRDCTRALLATLEQDMRKSRRKRILKGSGFWMTAVPSESSLRKPVTRESSAFSTNCTGRKTEQSSKSFLKREISVITGPSRKLIWHCVI